MVPFNKKIKTSDGKETQIKVAQFQLGYKGYVQLAIRSGYYKKINVLAIKEGELIKYDPLTEELEVNLIEDDETREQTATTGYYAMFEYMNGFRKTLYWSKQKMLAHADNYSKAFSKDAYEKLQEGKIPEKDLWKYSSFWYKDFDGMAYKTMLRQLISKWGIMSIELQNAMEKDMAEIKDDGTPDYIDTAPENEIEYMSETLEEPTENEEINKKEETSPNNENIEDSFFNN